MLLWSYLHHVVEGLPKEKIAMNGAMGFELEPNATDYRVAPTPETIPLAVRRRSCINHLLVSATKRCFFPCGLSARLVKVLRLEFQIIQDATAPVNTTNGSSLWQLSNVRIYGDVLHCDESLQNTYARHLLNGKNLTIPMRSYTSLSFSQPSGGANATLMIPRTLSRVNAIFLVGRKATQETATSKEVNRFCYPGGNAANQLLNHKSLQAWLQIGSSRFPSAGQYEGVNMFYYKWLSGIGNREFRSPYHSDYDGRLQNGQLHCLLGSGNDCKYIILWIVACGWQCFD